MVTFGLVHGAFHGSWCWQRLTPELERLGHRVLAVDLPSEDPRVGASEYAAAALTYWALANR
jgi:pimeloyl-ACP methyl ester carboxylesterase